MDHIKARMKIVERRTSVNHVTALIAMKIVCVGRVSGILALGNTCTDLDHSIFVYMGHSESETKMSICKVESRCKHTF